MSMSKCPTFRVPGGSWKRVNALFTPSCVNRGASYRCLSMVLGQQRPQQKQQQSSGIRQAVYSNLQMSRSLTHFLVPKERREHSEPGPEPEPETEAETGAEAGLVAESQTEQEKLHQLEHQEQGTISQTSEGQFTAKKEGGYVVLEVFPLRKTKKKQVSTLLFGEFWLRDNCQCSKCIHPDTRQRSVNTFEIPKDISAESITFDEDNASVQWSDGHVGFYPLKWLKIYDNKASKNLTAPLPTFRKYRTFPPGNPKAKHPVVAYGDVMSDDKGLYEWLDKIYSWGYCFVQGVPIEPEKTKELIERIAFIRHTHYGGFWDFTADLTYKDTAYTNEHLAAHTDNTYFTDPARLQLFHLLSHTDIPKGQPQGGHNLLVDGFRAAQILSEEAPHHARALITYSQPAHSSGNEDTVITPLGQFPVFMYDVHYRRMYQVRWNNYDRATKKDWDVVGQRQWYEAARHFEEITRRRDVAIWSRLEPGTALMFDNWRMMHGRSEFSGKRRMCGGYVNNDDFLSKYRLLRFGREHVLRHLGNSDFMDKENPNLYF